MSDRPPNLDPFTRNAIIVLALIVFLSLVLCIWGQIL